MGWKPSRVSLMQQPQAAGRSLNQIREKRAEQDSSEIQESVTRSSDMNRNRQIQGSRNQRSIQAGSEFHESSNDLRQTRSDGDRCERWLIKADIKGVRMKGGRELNLQVTETDALPGERQAGSARQAHLREVHRRPSKEYQGRGGTSAHASGSVWKGVWHAREWNSAGAPQSQLWISQRYCFFLSPRCLPNLCEHGARCSQTWSSFSCDCSGTGYSGATCHNSIYESSCEAYKLSGSSSGFYFIDPDGSGPLGPTQVYCNMTEKKVWTVLSHNSTAPVKVQKSSPQRPHIMKFNYNASADQLRAIVARSEQCQQEVVYNCRKSRLFNTKDGSPLSWWLDRDGDKRSYWGGFLPGVQQCSCSLEENCVDMNYFCNCDADTDSWANDTGLLSYKDHLPVSQIVIGDTNRTGSQAVYHVGSLRCYGDKSIWNAASFYQEASYLYFPTLQAELASDISFYFKTSSPSGVFLENQGLKDFIRVELSSPAVVTFSFDVGNGPAVLSVKSHLPLNDRQWHYVRAERNVKEASLQVDQLPLRLLEAPADGHLRLRLSSQLFVGGTASQQRGFLGCIRSLMVNGLTFDLEERAKMTPGVSSGCPGYCSGSSSLCHNRGRCIEKSNGYICDCSQSAYGGATCNQGFVSGHANAAENIPAPAAIAPGPSLRSDANPGPSSDVPTMSVSQSIVAPPFHHSPAVDQFSASLCSNLDSPNRSVQTLSARVQALGNPHTATSSLPSASQRDPLPPPPPTFTLAYARPEPALGLDNFEFPVNLLHETDP
ncbi:PREDICTED: contactin-associated protein-like 5 [Cyprinodon variegatus]|uniref:contactin-associated protein-like 5 n=1 Tax=Cyprinodon variegatus TaxID=28743 RepID=UPI000742BE58|nr:PREDICTED: contactin-associated protein-like 5 [Cyprinodon variegatus]